MARGVNKIWFELILSTLISSFLNYLNYKLDAFNLHINLQFSTAFYLFIQPAAVSEMSPRSGRKDRTRVTSYPSRAQCMYYRVKFQCLLNVIQHTPSIFNDYC